MGGAFEDVAGVIVGWQPADPTPTAASVHGDAHAAGRRLLAEAMARAGGTDATVSARCAHCGATDHGRPTTASGDVVVSVAYAAGIVVVAAAPAGIASAIGIDVEVDRPGALDDLAAMFSPLPAPDVRRWTQLEAALKADGRGVRVPPERVAVTTVSGRTLATVPDRPVHVELFDVTGAAGYCISLAVLRRRADRAASAR